jgi:hypothetical protein
MKSEYILFFMIILAGAICTAGCINTTSANVTTQTITPTRTVPPQTPPVVNVTANPTPVTTGVAPAVTIPATVQPAPTVDTSVYSPVTTDPFVTTLTFNKVQYVNSYGQLTKWEIPDCYMAEILPDIVNNPNYGVNTSYANITAISPQQFNVIWMDYGEGANQNSQSVGAEQCKGAPVYHEWTFIDISAAFTPRNARPADYEIAFAVRGMGKDLGIFTTTQLLTLDQPVEIDSYVPIRVDQSDLITSVELRFYKLD